MSVKTYSPVVYLEDSTTAYTYNPDGSGTLIPLAGGEPSTPSAVAIEQLDDNVDLLVDDFTVVQTVDITLDSTSYIFMAETAQVNGLLLDAAIPGRLVFQVTIDDSSLIVGVTRTPVSPSGLTAVLQSFSLMSPTTLAAGVHTVKVLASMSAEFDNAQVSSGSMLSVQQIRA